MRKNEVERYAELLYLPHHTSSRHPPMPRENRAAQFAPFAALTGHVDAVAETARLTQPRAALDEGVIAELDARIGQLRAQIGTQPAAEITYFVPDHKKEGGAYADRYAAAFVKYAILKSRSCWKTARSCRWSR